ncbi:MAG: hypothetical protein IIC84_08095 [Chloroflexi bacterium]|nr:hypothetical protein [Chloroflexota bacterium]
MIAKAWRRLPTPPAGFSASMGLPAFHAHLLYNRGIRQRAEIEPFLIDGDQADWDGQPMFQINGRSLGTCAAVNLQEACEDFPSLCE